MAKEFFLPSNVAETRKRFGYVPAVKAGNTIYLAGWPAWDENGNVVGKGDFVAQLAQIYENIKRTLEATGASMADIVKMTYFCKDVRLFQMSYPQLGPIHREYFGHNYPPGTAVQVAALWDPDMLAEVEVIAVVD